MATSSKKRKKRKSPGTHSRHAFDDVVDSTAAAMRSSASVVRHSLSGKRSAPEEASRIAGATVQAMVGPLESTVKAVVGGTVGAVAGAISGVTEAVRQTTVTRRPTNRD